MLLPLPLFMVKLLRMLALQLPFPVPLPLMIHCSRAAQLHEHAATFDAAINGG